MMEIVMKYAGIGMALVLIGLVMIIAAVVKLVRHNAEDRRMSVAEFNQQFVRDTRYNISDVEAGAKRTQIADSLRIGEKYSNYREEQ